MSNDLKINTTSAHIKIKSVCCRVDVDIFFDQWIILGRVLIYVRFEMFICTYTKLKYSSKYKKRTVGH